MKLFYKNLLTIICIITILVSVSGCTTTNTTPNNTTPNNTTPNNTTPNNTSNNILKNNTNDNNTATYISPEKAKEIASQYTGMGVGKGTLGTPKLTTFNGVKYGNFLLTMVFIIFISTQLQVKEFPIIEFIINFKLLFGVT